MNTSILLYSFLAGIVTSLGAVLTYWFTWRRRTIAFAFGFSAGVMLYVAYFSMLPTAIQYGGFRVLVLGLVGTVVFMCLLHLLHLRKVEKGESCTAPQLERVGFFLIIAVIAHHLPEGAAIGVGFEAEHQMGVMLVIALAIHNLPEGIALALPLVAAGRPFGFVFGFSLLCGMSLPLGTWLGLTFLDGSVWLMALSLAFAAAVMVWIMVTEVFPHALALGKRMAIGGLAVGGVFMYVVHLFH